LQEKRGESIGTNPKITEAYQKVKTSYAIREADSEELVILLNKELVREVMKSILDTSTDMIGRIYG
jgi:hypothetical protein